MDNGLLDLPHFVVFWSRTWNGRSLSCDP